jgi:hypothetical protein
MTTVAITLILTNRNKKRKEVVMNCGKCSDTGVLGTEICTQVGCVAAQARIEYKKYCATVDFKVPLPIVNFAEFLAAYRKNIQPKPTYEKLGTDSWLRFEKATVSSSDTGITLLRPLEVSEKEFELLYNQVLQLLGERKTV